MKHIMISVRPEWVCKILNREKTLEIRNSVPKEVLNGEECLAEIYCTKGGKHLAYDEFSEIIDMPKYTLLSKRYTPCLNGKVVARFTLKKVDKIEICDPYVFRNGEQEDWWYFEKNACLTCEQMMEYIGYGEDHDGWDKKYDTGYAWHTDNLIIYDKPKSLEEFGVKRPFQSWGYIE